MLPQTFVQGLGTLSSTFWGSSAHDHILNNSPDTSYVPRYEAYEAYGSVPSSQGSPILIFLCSTSGSRSSAGFLSVSRLESIHLWSWSEKREPDPEPEADTIQEEAHPSAEPGLGLRKSTDVRPPRIHWTGCFWTCCCLMFGLLSLSEE